MFLYNLSLQVAGGVQSAAYGNFSAPKAQEVVVSRGKARHLPSRHCKRFGRAACAGLSSGSGGAAGAGPSAPRREWKDADHFEVNFLADGFSPCTGSEKECGTEPSACVQHGGVRLHTCHLRVQAHRREQGEPPVGRPARAGAPSHASAGAQDHVIIASDSGRIVIVSYDKERNVWTKVLSTIINLYLLY